MGCAGSISISTNEKDKITALKSSEDPVGKEREEKERKEREEKERKEREEKEKKEKEEKEKKEKEEKDRKEREEKEIKEKQFKFNLHILVKNLESKQIEREIIKKKFEETFEDLSKNTDFKKDDVMEKISNIFINYLNPLNKNNKDTINNLIKELYERTIKPKDKDLDKLKSFIFDILDNVTDYKYLKKEDEEKIDDYIIKVLKYNKKITENKEKLKANQKNNNYVIKYEEFTNIVKEFQIFMENLAIEYLLYKMKFGMSLDEDKTLDSLNFKIFLDYLDKGDKIIEEDEKNDKNENKETENNNENNNKENIGYNLTNNASIKK